MAAPYLDPYIAPFKPLTNITPFTIKDGQTYLETLEDLRAFLNTEFVDFVNTNFTELGDDFETQVNTLIAQVNAAIQSVIESSAEAQDAVVTELVENAESLLRIALDTLYAGQVTDAAVAAIVVAGDTKTALDMAYAGQVTDAAIEAIVTDTEGDTREALDNLYAGQVTDAAIEAIVTDTDGDTKTALDDAYAGQVTDEAVAAIVVAGSTKTALDTAYAGQVTNAGIAAIVATGDTKAALDGAYAGKVFVEGFLTADGIILPAFETAELPDPTEFDDGVIVFDTDESLIKISVSGAWTALEGGGGDSIGTLTEGGQLAIGNDIVAPSSGWPSITIGSGANNDAPVSVALGDNTVIAGGGSAASGVAIGYGATLGDTVEPSAMGNGVAIGANAKAHKTGGGFSSVAIGDSAEVDGGSYAVALGGGSSADADYAVAVGGSAESTAANATAIGRSANVSAAGGLAVGYASNVDTIDGIAIGNGASVTGTDSAQIGQGTNSDDDTLQSRYPTFKMPNLTITALSSYIPTMNGAALIYPGGLSEPPTTGLVVGVSYFDTTEGKPLWLKTIESLPEDNEWVDASGTVVYPAP